MQLCLQPHAPRPHTTTHNNGVPWCCRSCLGQRKELDQQAKQLHGEHEAAVESLVAQHKRKADGLQSQLDTTTKRLADATSRGDMLDDQLRSVGRAGGCALQLARCTVRLTGAIASCVIARASLHRPSNSCMMPTRASLASSKRTDTR